MVVAEAYLPIIFAVVFEVCFQTVVSLNNYDTLTAFGTEWPIRDKSWYLVINWPCVIKALSQIGLVGSPVLIFKGPIGAIKFQVKSEELDFNSGFRGHWVSRSLK